MKHTTIKILTALLITFSFAAGIAGTALAESAESAGPGMQAPAAAAEAEKSPDRILAEEAVAVVNRERVNAGVNTLAIDETMMAGAKIRAQEIFSLFSHTRPDGRDCFSIFTDLDIKSGYRGENVMYASLCPAETAVSALMGSEGHKGNIVSPRFTRIGVGYYENSGIGYWVQLFAE